MQIATQHKKIVHYWPTVLAALILSVFFTWASLINPSSYYDLKYSDFKLGLVAFVSFITYGIAIFVFEQFLIWLFNRFSSLSANTKFVIGKKWYVIVPLLFALAWLPYILITYPGVVSWDGADQLNSFFQVAMPAQNIHFYGIEYNGLHQQFYLTNHHPYLTSLVLANLFSMGQGLAAGLLAIVVFNTVILALSLSLVTNKVAQISRPWGLTTGLFFALFPAFPIMAVNVNKTAIAVAAFAFFITMVFNLWQKGASWPNAVLLLVSSILLVLVRNDSFILILAMMIAALFNKKSRKTVLLVGALTLIFSSLWTRLVLPHERVLPSEKVEMLAVPGQQIARTLVEGGNISNGQLKQLANFADLNLVKSSYVPTFYDPVKHAFYYYPDNFWQQGKTYQENLKEINGGYFNQNLGRYLKLWLDIGKNNLGIYLAALLNNSYQYFSFINNPVNVDLFLNGGLVPYENTSLFQGYHQTHTRAIGRAQSLVNKISTTKGIALIFKTGFWGSLTLILFAIAVEVKCKPAISIGIIGVSVLAIAAISPVNGLNRYIYPLYCLLPLLVVLIQSASQSMKHSSS